MAWSVRDLACADVASDAGEDKTIHQPTCVRVLDGGCCVSTSRYGRGERVWSVMKFEWWNWVWFEGGVLGCGFRWSLRAGFDLFAPLLQVVYIKEGPPCNIVILDPVWLGLRIFGPALSPENSIITQLKSMTGYVNLSALQRVYPELDPVSAISLFEHFQLCTPVDANRFNFLFPCLIKMEPIHGLWGEVPGVHCVLWCTGHVSSLKRHLLAVCVLPRSRSNLARRLPMTLRTRS